MEKIILLSLGAFCTYVSLCCWDTKSWKINIYKWSSIVLLVLLAIFPCQVCGLYWLNLLCTILFLGIGVAAWSGIFYFLFARLGFIRYSKFIHSLTGTELNLDDFS